MADITVSNNIQLLPPLRGQIGRSATGGARYLPDLPGLVGSQMLSAQGQKATAEINSASSGAYLSVNVVQNSGLILYDSFQLALTGQSRPPLDQGPLVSRGSLVDILA